MNTQTTEENNKKTEVVDSSNRSQVNINGATSIMLEFIKATGIRVGELCALEINDINWVNKYIDITKTARRIKDNLTGEVVIKVGPPKTECSVRRIPLSPGVEDLLDKQTILVTEMWARAGDKWNENALVFPTGEGNIQNPDALKLSMRQIIKLEGLPYTTIHDARHAYIAEALNTGVTAKDLAMTLGTKDDDVAQRTADIYWDRGSRGR